MTKRLLLSLASITVIIILFYLGHIFQNPQTSSGIHLFIDPKYIALMDVYKKEARSHIIENNKGIILPKHKQKFPCKIQFKNKQMNASIRLKGDWTDHLEDDKWSFRITLTGKDRLFGLKSFSLQHPKRRNYIYEWIYHALLKQKQLISLYYDFIPFYLNNSYQGLYAIEEHMTKNLYFHNQRRDSVTLKFDETLYWADLALNGRHGHYLQSRETAPIRPFQEKNVLHSPKKRALFDLGRYLLEGFSTKQLSTSQAFNMDTLAQFIILSEFMGAKLHQIYWHNARFYVDPITATLEPIGFDSDSGETLKKREAHRFLLAEFDNFFFLWFEDPLFYATYMKHLYTLVHNDLLAPIKTPLLNRHQQLTQTLLNSPPFTVTSNIILDNQQTLKSAFTPKSPFSITSKSPKMIGITNDEKLPFVITKINTDSSPTLIQERLIIYPKRTHPNHHQETIALPYPVHGNNTINIHFHPLGHPHLTQSYKTQINNNSKKTKQQYSFSTKAPSKQLPFLLAYHHSQPQHHLIVGNPHPVPMIVTDVIQQEKSLIKVSLTLPKKTVNTPITYQTISLPDTIKQDAPITLQYHDTNNKHNTSEVLAWDRYPTDITQHSPFLNPAFKKTPPFCEINHDTKFIQIKPGNWTLDRPWITPKGYRLNCNKNTSLTLENNAFIISQGPCYFKGTKEAPIQFIAKHDGQGLLITAKVPSQFSYVNISGLQPPKYGKWDLTGGLTAYNTTLSLSHCTFSNNQSGDDYVNIIRSSFSISDCHFQETKRDAIDSDFSSGSIKHTSFKSVGQDAIDTANSTLTLLDITIEDVKDKGISAGEKSHLNITSLTIKNAEIGIASKDDSLVEGSKITITKTKKPLLAYSKKAGFGDGLFAITDPPTNPNKKQ